MRSLLLALLALLPAWSAHAQTGAAPAAAPFNRTIWVAPNGFIRVFHLTGTLRIEGWDRDSLSVTGTPIVPPGGEFVISPGKQGAKVTLWGPDETRAQPAHLVLRVPRSSQLWVKTQSADVTIRNFTGGLDVVTVTGDVEVAGSPSEVLVETMGGQANLSVQSRSVRVKTGTGQVTLRGTIDAATISSVSGPLFALDTQIKQARFESVDGNISYTGEVARPADLEFVTHGGNVELQLSERSLAAVNINTFDGAFSNEWGATAKEFGGKLKGKEYYMELGADAIADITVRTFKGTVTIRRIR